VQSRVLRPFVLIILAHLVSLHAGPKQQAEKIRGIFHFSKGLEERAITPIGLGWIH
jgi:hypothetical protein